MLSLELLHDQPDLLIEGLQRRYVQDADTIVRRLQAQETERRRVLHKLEQQRAEMNRISKTIGELMSQNRPEEAEQAKAQTQSLKQEISELETELAQVQKRLDEELIQLPNLPHESVPKGEGEDANQLVKDASFTPALPAQARPHWELGEQLGILDLERGAKVTGSGFPVFCGAGAKLQRALIRYFLAQAEEAGYREYHPPFLVNEDTAFGTGQLPDKEGQMYHLTQDDLYLIPTSEVPLTNLFRNELLHEDELPLKLCAYSPCFRREAGAHGKKVRGLNRIHQFEKVEIVQITRPADSYTILEEMTQYVEGLLEALELPYRRQLLCTGDTSFAAAKTYDLEVYSAAQGAWLEVSSVSNFERFQAQRMKLRYRPQDTKHSVICHTLNGSALALPRLLAALLENGQQADGSIRLPAAIAPYTGFGEIEPAAASTAH
jgi:seryl-tRNA synthetase